MINQNYFNKFSIRICALVIVIVFVSLTWLIYDNVAKTSDSETGHNTSNDFVSVDEWKVCKWGTGKSVSNKKENYEDMEFEACIDDTQNGLHQLEIIDNDKKILDDNFGDYCDHSTGTVFYDYWSDNDSFDGAGNDIMDIQDSEEEIDEGLLKYTFVKRMIFKAMMG